MSRPREHRRPPAHHPGCAGRAPKVSFVGAFPRNIRAGRWTRRRRGVQPSSGELSRRDFRLETERDAYMRSSDSPALPAQRATFQPLPDYVIDEQYNVPAGLKVIRGDDVIEMSTSSGKPRRMRRIGTLAFTLKGQAHTLTAFAEVDDTSLQRLFVPFGDLTNGLETYQGGRYLDLDSRGSGVYGLRFQPGVSPVLRLQSRGPVPDSTAREPAPSADQSGRAQSLMAEIKAIVFDFDGVLANSEPLHLRAFQAVLREQGVTLERDEYDQQYLGFDDVTASGRRASGGAWSGRDGDRRHPGAGRPWSWTRSWSRPTCSIPSRPLHRAARRGHAARHRLGSTAARDRGDPAPRPSGAPFKFIVAAGDTVSASPRRIRIGARPACTNWIPSSASRSRIRAGHRVGQGCRPSLRGHDPDLSRARSSCPVPTRSSGPLDEFTLGVVREFVIAVAVRVRGRGPGVRILGGLKAIGCLDWRREANANEARSGTIDGARLQRLTRSFSGSCHASLTSPTRSTARCPTRTTGTA